MPWRTRWMRHALDAASSPGRLNLTNGSSSTIPRAAPARQPALGVSYPARLPCSASAVRLKIPSEALDQGPSRTAGGRRVASLPMPRDTPILVTGSHRSGSTWVGQMLAAGSEVGYIREPFSVLHRPGVLDMRFPYWFPYICAENEGPYVAPVRDMLAFRYHVGAGLRGIRTPTDAGKLANDVVTFGRYRRAAPQAAAEGPDRRLLRGVARGAIRPGRGPAGASPGCVRQQPEALRVDASVRGLPGAAAAHARSPGAVRGRDQRLRRHPAPAVRSGDPAVAADPPRHRRVPRPPPRLAHLSTRGPGERSGERVSRHVRAAGSHVRPGGTGRRRSRRPIHRTRRRRRTTARSGATAGRASGRGRAA